MAVFIHREPQLHKCLTKIRRAGGRAALAAERIEEIITALASMVQRCHGAEMPLMVRQADAVTLSPDHNATACDMDYDELLMQNIDEKMLRRVFRGLCGDL